LIEVLLYSIVNVLVVLLSLAALAVAFFGEEDNLRKVITGGLEGFPPDEHLHGFLWASVYVLVALLFAEISGSTQLLLRVRTFVATLFFYGDNWTHSTIWYWAIDERTRSQNPNRAVGARVILKDGSLYTGVLANYPVLGDDAEKDFVMQHVHRYNADQRAFEAFGDRMSLLLNSRDCWSIQVGPGPEQELPARSRWEEGMQIFLWAALLAGSAVTAATLASRPSTDLLVKMLTFFSATVAIWSLLGLFRYGLKSRSPSRWDDVKVQRLWLFAGGMAMVSLLFTLTGAQLSVAIFGSVAAVALIVLSLRVPVGQSPTTA
jgi:hypothetical protein